MLWIVVDALHIPLVLLALAAPFIGLGAGLILDRRAGRQRHQRQMGKQTGAGCVIGGLVMPVLLYLGMCTPPSGEGIDARAGRAWGQTIVVALDSFRIVFGAYPDSLTRLVPRFLAEAALTGPGRSSYPFAYRLEGDGFELRFRYVGPGTNECALHSRTRTWSCSGYY